MAVRAGWSEGHGEAQTDLRALHSHIAILSQVLTFCCDV